MTMKKFFARVLGGWRKAAGWLASFGADRWMHLVAGLVVAYVAGCADMRIGGGPLWSAGLVGLLAALVAGFFKEIADSFTGSRGDLVDCLFTTTGGAAGFGLLMLGGWLLWQT